MTLKPYPAYKDSGVPWLGEIPEHWEVRRTKYLLRETDARSQTGAECLLSVSQYTGVTPRQAKANSEEPHTRADSLIGYKKVNRNDLVVNIMLAWNGSMGVSAYEGIVSPAYCVYRFNHQEIKSEDFHYLFRTNLYKIRIKKASTGVVDSRLRLYSDKLGQIEALLPTNEEQTAIARFLDWKTAQINKFIRNKRKLVALLKEQKQAIINQAVTRGINPDVWLKPSGVEWLGEIPEHWEVRRFSNLSHVIRGASPRPSGDPRFYFGGFIPWVTVGEVTKDSAPYLINTTIGLTEHGYQNSRFIPRDTLIITNSGATLGVPKILAIDVCANDGIVAFTKLSTNINKLFAYYFLTSLTMRIREEIKQGGTQPNLNTTIIKSISCPVPPINEQEEITRYIQAQTDLINLTITRAEREIELMGEYRTRLISDVVTGKVDVRDIPVEAVPEEELLQGIEAEDPEAMEEAEIGEEEAV